MNSARGRATNLRKWVGGRWEVVGDVSWTAVNDVLQLVLTTATFLMFGKSLGPEAYGGYVGVFAVVAPFSAFVTQGSSFAVLQRVLQMREDRVSVARRYLTMAWLVGPIGVIASVIIAKLTVESVGLGPIVAFCTVELIANATVDISSSVVRTEFGQRPAIRIRIGYTIVRFLPVLVLFLRDDLSIGTLATAWIVVLPLYMVFVVLVLLPARGVRMRVLLPSTSDLRTTGGLASPIFFNQLHQGSDKVVLNATNHVFDAGLYGAAYRMMEMSMLPLKTLTTATFHRFIIHDPTQRGQHIRRAKIYTAVTLLASAPIAVFTYFAAPWLIWLVGDDFKSSVSILRWLLLTVPIRACLTGPINGLLGLGKIATRAYLRIGTAATSVTLYLLLVPSMSWKGAVIGTIGGDIVLLVSAWVMLVRAQRAHDRQLLEAEAVSAEQAVPQGNA